MVNPRLTDEQMILAKRLLEEIRAKLIELAGGDSDALFAYRRKVAKELIYDERNRPAYRRRLKILMRKRQDGLCAICRCLLPDTHAILDRYVASRGYVESNVQLICKACDDATQAERRYK